MKKIELRLISEIMKDSNRSDRELAKAIGVSQPTISRIKSKLQKEGYIREYTIVPDFAKLGFELMALTFLKYKTVTAEEIGKASKVAKKLLEETYDECILVEMGDGLGYQAIIISLHENYSSYDSFMNRIKQGAIERYPFMDTSNYRSFLISLRSDQHFRPLTLSSLANHLLTMKEKKE